MENDKLVNLLRACDRDSFFDGNRVAVKVYFYNEGLAASALRCFLFRGGVTSTIYDFAEEYFCDGNEAFEWLEEHKKHSFYLEIILNELVSDHFIISKSLVKTFLKEEKLKQEERRKLVRRGAEQPARY